MRRYATYKNKTTVVIRETSLYRSRSNVSPTLVFCSTDDVYQISKPSIHIWVNSTQCIKKTVKCGPWNILTPARAIRSVAGNYDEVISQVRWNRYDELPWSLFSSTKFQQQISAEQSKNRSAVQHGIRHRKWRQCKHDDEIYRRLRQLQLAPRQLTKHHRRRRRPSQLRRYKIDHWPQSWRFALTVSCSPDQDNSYPSPMSTVWSMYRSTLLARLSGRSDKRPPLSSMHDL